MSSASYSVWESTLQPHWEPSLFSLRCLLQTPNEIIFCLILKINLSTNVLLTVCIYVITIAVYCVNDSISVASQVQPSLWFSNYNTA